MINEETLNNLHQKTLIDEESFEKVEKDQYSSLSPDELYIYGKTLITNKEFEKATKCFEKCYELDSNHIGACLQLFFRSVYNKDYESAFKYLEVIQKDSNYTNDANLYLYLLNFITDIPEPYKMYVRYFTMEDIEIPFNDNKYRKIPEQNKIRTLALQQKFTYAVQQLGEIITKFGTSNINDLITRTLLYQAATITTLSKDTLLQLAKNKQYNEIILHLEAKEHRHNLSLNDECILKLTKDLLNICNNSIIPEKTIVQTDKTYKAIKGNNYELALRLSSDYNKINNIADSENTLSLLLTDICTQINQLQRSTNKTIEEPIKDVIKFLKQLDLDNALMTLKKHMALVDKTKYESLIIDLIKISLLEKDITFNQPITTLNLISEGKYSFDISNYIKEFYTTLSQNKFEEARVYLDIISKSPTFGINIVLMKELNQILALSEQKLNYQQNSIISSSFKKVINYLTTDENQIKNEVIEEKVIEEKVIEEKLENEQEFIAKKRKELLKNQGMILLNPMEDDMINKILEVVTEYPDIEAFTIGEGKEKQIVLRYKPKIKEYIDIKMINALGSEAYERKDYDECIKHYLKLLQLFIYPNAKIYLKLGSSYMKKMNIPLATDYMKVAVALIKNETNKIGFYMKNLTEINNYISESGLDVESACKQINMEQDQINIVKLLYAKEFYTEGDLEKGDLFLQSVAKSEAKTKEMLNLIEEIRTNKKFYQYRETINPIIMDSSLIPKSYEKVRK